MASMTFTQAVTQISEVLSEGVSKFTLFVVTMKKRNQPAPPSLANAVDVISNQASQLANLANNLANGYADYPAIQGKILSESAGLDSAQKNLLSTCNSLKGTAGSTELQNSWEKLSSACRSIANAVIALLEILFSAEVERIYATNEKLQSAISTAVSFPAAQIGDNQQKFADCASDSASYANHLAQFLSMRAQSEESPSHQVELQAAAQSLLQSAQEIVNKANDCMDEPDDAQRTQQFNHLNNTAATTANEIIKRIREVEAERSFARVPPPAPVPVAQKANPLNMEAPASYSPQTATRVNKPPQKSAQQQANSPSRAPTASPIPNKPAQNKQTQNKPVQKRQAPPRGRNTSGGGKATNMNQIVDMAKDLAQNNQGKELTGAASDLHIEIEKLAKAAAEGDGAMLLQCARNVANITNKFAKDVRSASSGCSNAKAKENIVQDTRCLADLCTQLKIMASVKASLCDSNNKMDQDEQLIYLTNNLIKTWKQTGDHLQVADLLQ